MVSKRQLLFKPNEHDEEYLEKTGKINNWHDTVREWIARDKKLDKKALLDRLQNSFILIFTGVITFAFSYLIMMVRPTAYMFIAILFVMAVIAVAYGSFSIVWELLLSGKR